MADRICNCGTCKDAMDTALKLCTEMVDNDCPNWMVQVTAMMDLLTQYYMTGLVDQMSPSSNTVRELMESYRKQMTNTILDHSAMLTDFREKARVKRKESGLDEAETDLNDFMNSLFKQVNPN